MGLLLWASQRRFEHIGVAQTRTTAVLGKLLFMHRVDQA